MIKHWVKNSRPAALLLASGGLALATTGLGAAASALDWNASPGYRSAALPMPSSGQAGFTLLPPAVTGITFTNVLSDAQAAENQIRLNGSGVAGGDVDGDGRCDLYFCGLENGNKLYRNLGDGKFADITDAAGVAGADQYSSGAVFADVNGDGHLDLLVNGIGKGTRLFLNDGQGRFQATPGGGLVHQFAATSLTLADIDGDGSLDLYVPNYRTTTIRTTGLAMLRVNGKIELRPEDREDYELTPQGLILESGEPHLLYRNDGHGNFQPLSWTDGTFRDEDGRPLAKTPKEWGLSAVFRDVNGDRAPDLFVCGDFHSPDRTWINDGKGHFRAIARTALRNSSTFSMALDFADVNRDGLDDFIDLDMLDLEHARRVVQFSTMEPAPLGLAGVLDRPQFNRNTVQLNRGDGTFAETAYYCGLEASGWTWSAIFLDVDLDGYEDLLMSTGHQFDTQDLDASQRIEALGPLGKARMPSKILMYPRLTLPRVAFRNLGNLRFEECGAAWGFNDLGVTHGMALADLDNDGDLDVVQNSLNGPARIYRNDSAAPRVAVRLKGLPPNTRGIGARIIVRGGVIPMQSQEMMCGGRYLSGDDNVRVFAAGSETNRMSLEVLWRSGRNSFITNLPANRVYEIDERAAVVPAPPPATAPARPLFEDASGLIGHTHQDDAFDDFARQPLLPNRLSQLGPGVAWADLEGTGRDDLVIGSGKGGRLAVYRNDGRGGFKLDNQPLWAGPVARDQAGIVSWGKAGLLVGSANYEDGQASGSAVSLFAAGKPRATDLLPAWDSSVGPLAVADYDADGALDLFVGARVKAGQYPVGAASRLYRQRESRLVLDEANTKVLAGAGLVSGAVWSDLDGDGFPELILACEWGPLRIFQNDRGRLSLTNFALALRPPGTLNAQRSSLNQLTGWWNGVATADLDGDGRMDIIASNWGLNTKYRTSEEHPRKLYHGDFRGSGTVDLIEAYFDRRLGKEVPEREFEAVAEALPFLRGVFRSHHAYALAGIADVLGELPPPTSDAPPAHEPGAARPERGSVTRSASDISGPLRVTDPRSEKAVAGERAKLAQALSVNTLASMAFLNRTNGWVAQPLPFEAQIAPAFAVVVADFDGDGAEDVYLSQNFFATQPQTTRADAGRGVWLRGDGRGGLNPVSGQQSGLVVYGEQRGAAVADYDQDGRVDLVVTQNGAATRLFHNVSGRPGLRVRLTGPVGNPMGVGGVVRLRFGERLGPAREIHAGSGYWSQASPVQVLGTPVAPTAVWVRWPGGETQQAVIPQGAKEIEVRLANAREK